MKTERLIVLVSPEEKNRITALAERQRKSVGELVRTALSNLEAASKPNGLAVPAEEEDGLSPEQAAALESLATTALSSMQRANAALDRAFEEVEATKAHLAKQKRAKVASA